MIKLNTLTQGDCLEVMRDIEDKSIDMILTDIPYGKVNRASNGLRVLDKGLADEVYFNIEKLSNELCRISKGSIYVFCGTEQVSKIRERFVVNGLSTRLIIWEKTNPSPMNGQHIWLSSVECCVFGKNKNAVFNEHCKSSVIRFPCGRNKIHPTQKPIVLFEYLIKTSSKKGDTILDPFAGSGTTAVACINTHRNYILIEQSAEYCAVIEKRIEGHRHKLAQEIDFGGI